MSGLATLNPDTRGTVEAACAVLGYQRGGFLKQWQQFWGLHTKDYSSLGSVLGSTYLRKLAKTMKALGAGARILKI